jgi:hypothetical protein
MGSRGRDLTNAKLRSNIENTVQRLCGKLLANAQEAVPSAYDARRSQALGLARKTPLAL